MSARLSKKNQQVASNPWRGQARRTSDMHNNFKRHITTSSVGRHINKHKPRQLDEKISDASKCHAAAENHTWPAGSLKSPAKSSLQDFKQHTNTNII